MSEETYEAGMASILSGIRTNIHVPMPYGGAPHPMFKAPRKRPMEEQPTPTMRWRPIGSESTYPFYCADKTHVTNMYIDISLDKGVAWSDLDEAWVNYRKNHIQISISLFDEPTGQSKTASPARNIAFVELQGKLVPVSGMSVEAFGSRCRNPDGLAGHADGDETIPLYQASATRAKKEQRAPDAQPIVLNGAATLERLHFQIATPNNARKKGLPNPHQQYYCLIVVLNVVTRGRTLTVLSHVSDPLIVRGGNPGLYLAKELGDPMRAGRMMAEQMDAPHRSPKRSKFNNEPIPAQQPPAALMQSPQGSFTQLVGGGRMPMYDERGGYPSDQMVVVGTPPAYSTSVPPWARPGMSPQFATGSPMIPGYRVDAWAQQLTHSMQHQMENAYQPRYVQDVYQLTPSGERAGVPASPMDPNFEYRQVPAHMVAAAQQVPAYSNSSSPQAFLQSGFAGSPLYPPGPLRSAASPPVRAAVPMGPPHSRPAGAPSTPGSAGAGAAPTGAPGSGPSPTGDGRQWANRTVGGGAVGGVVSMGAGAAGGAGARGDSSGASVMRFGQAQAFSQLLGSNVDPMAASRGAMRYDPGHVENALHEHSPSMTLEQSRVPARATDAHGDGEGEDDDDYSDEG